MFIKRFISAALFVAFTAAAQDSPITLLVNATDGTRNILHGQLRIPAKPGELTLVYPKWIPGEHGPTGPIIDLAGVKMLANGKPVPWRRDDVDMYAFHLDVPAGADAVDVSVDYLMPPNTGEFSSGGSSTAQLVDINWSQLVLYPRGANPAELRVTPSLQLPSDWHFGTALPRPVEFQGPNGLVYFSPVTLERLIDSPVIAGKYYRSIDLSPKARPPHRLDMVADSAAALEIKPEFERDYKHLVTETGALFGARHYRSYDFLLTLSEHVGHFGLEHHECSDNREGEKYVTDDDEMLRGAYLLPHEMVHSWNGKYRRPAGLATPDYQEPMKGELLWVYEGLTDYLGIVLAARCGLWTNESFRQYVAQEAAMLDTQRGRDWRPLADTAIGAQLAYEARAEGTGWRRSTDFYSEGDLLWLETDVLIRQQTHGKKSLDDFCRAFYGGESGPPKVVPYTKEDIYAALNEITPHDWNGFFQQRVYEVQKHPPMGGIEGSGWKLVYTNVVPALLKNREGARKYTDMRVSLGLLLHEDGYITDVIPGSPADKAGMGTGTKLVAVNERRWTPELLREAVTAAKTHQKPLELLVENTDYFQTYKIKYYGGERYGILERDPAKPDLLTEILKPLTPAPAP